MIIYFNPECSKCKEAVDLLHSNHCEFEIRNYLKIPPSKKGIEDLLSKLGCGIEDLIRKAEPVYLEKFSSKKYSDLKWIEILIQYPILLQRPIVIEADKAVIGRPPVLVLDLIKK